MPIHFAPRIYPAQEGEIDKYTITIRPEMARCVMYFGFYSFVILAVVVTKIWAAPILEAGAYHLPREQWGCGPFNRDQEILGNSPRAGLSFGQGFTMEESHLYDDFGFSNICINWDYHPSREVVSMYFPLFEYSLTVYIFLNFIVTTVQYRRGLLPNWYLKLDMVVTPVCMLLSAWFRLIFVALAYESVSLHSVGFLGLQFALLFIAIMNVLYVLISGQSYPSLGLSTETVALLAKCYIVLNLIVCCFKMYGSIDIIFLSEPGSGYIYGSFWGKIIDISWLIFNAVIPPFVAYIRMKNEDPLVIDIHVPSVIFSGTDNPSNETTPLTN